MKYDVRINEGAEKLSEIFAKHKHKIYLVGGSVRNMILGLPQGDIDVCSAALPEEAAQFLRQEGCTIVEKAMSLGTIEVHLRQGGTKYVFEHTTLRQDYYHKGGQHRPYKVEFTDDINKDAKRRDFTTNALYLDIQTKEIFDPTGRGLKDSADGVLRAAADKAIDTLSDDGLRIMRMVRLCSELDFSIDDELLECAKSNVSLLADISAERKRQELERILLADIKYGKDKAHLKGLLLLSDICALEYVIAAMEQGRGIEQKKKYHTYDVLHHCIYSCGAAPPVLVLRLAALLHDIGKPVSLRTAGNMYDHEKYSKMLAKEALEELKFSNKTKAAVLTLIENHMFDLEGRAKPKTIRKRAVKLGRETFEMLIELRCADIAGSGKGFAGCGAAENWKKELDIMIETKVPWTVKDLDITGQELMDELGLKPSEEIGRILEELHSYCVLYPSANKKSLLIGRASKTMKK